MVIAKSSLISLILLLIFKAIILGFVVHKLFNGNIDEFLFEMKT